MEGVDRSILRHLKGRILGWRNSHNAASEQGCVVSAERPFRADRSGTRRDPAGLPQRWGPLQQRSYREKAGPVGALRRPRGPRCTDGDLGLQRRGEHTIP